MKANDSVPTQSQNETWDLPFRGPYSSEGKLQWEVAKLQQEVASLKKPWIRQPGSWISIVTTILALAAGGFNLSLATHRREINEWKAEKAKQEAQMARQLETNTRIGLRDTQNQVKSLMQQRSALQTKNAEFKNLFDRLIIVLDKSNDSKLKEEAMQLRVESETIFKETDQSNRSALSALKSINNDLKSIEGNLTDRNGETKAAPIPTQDAVKIDEVLLKKARGIFHSNYQVRQQSFNDLTRYWLSDQNTIPALLQAINEQPDLSKNLDGATNALRIMRHVERRFFKSNTAKVSALVKKIEAMPGAKKSNLSRELRFLKDRLQRAGAIGT